MLKQGALRRHLVKTKLKRLLSLALSYVLVLGLMPFEPTVVQAANATTLYITDAASGTVQTVTTDTTDSEGGWSYNAATATLTLNGFNGAYIEANGDLNIVLNGTNTITVASDSGYGIKVDGKLTIDDTTSSSDDSLNVICNEPKADAHMISTRRSKRQSLSRYRGQIQRRRERNLITRTHLPSRRNRPSLIRR